MGKCLFMRKGETHTIPSTGTLASDLAVGSIVKLMENGSPVDYIIVNQGIPSGSSHYDSSCNGTWLLRKDISENRQWHSSLKNHYDLSDIHSYLNNDFLNRFDSTALSVIKTVKIPYYTGGTAYSGANGVSARAFLLSGREIGWTSSLSSYLASNSACLSYFNGTALKDSKRIAYLNGTASTWWTRSPRTNGSSYVWEVTPDGGYDYDTTEYEWGIRPALIIPFNTLFNTSTLLLKGVS